MIKFAFISPIKTMEQAMKASDIHLALAHIDDEEYLDSLVKYKDKKLTILDNGAYENGVPMDKNTLFEVADRIEADIIVAPDYPGQDWRMNVRSQLNFYDEAKDRGFDVMFVPQSERGDLSGFIKSYKVFREYIDEGDLIGFSILGVPNALNRLPKHFARFELFRILLSEGIYPQPKSIHMLGLLNTPYEVALCKQFEGYINSWDSSQPVWSAYNDKRIDSIINKSILPKVDFKSDKVVDGTFLQFNIRKMKEILK